MRRLLVRNEEVLQQLILGAACLGAILTTVFSLTHGIFEVFSFWYILPIILSVYFYPRKATLFTLALSLVYIGQVWLFGFSNPTMIAVATAWFAIFIIIGVVASSFANQMHDEQLKIQNILENSQDGILCFDKKTAIILDVNSKCAGWLRFSPEELAGSRLALIWSDDTERERFLEGVRTDGKDTGETEGLFQAKDGTILRFVLSVVMVVKDSVFCSIIDITGSKIVDEEIHRTLEDLEEQVRARTAHLERINEELRREILERRQFEQTLLSAQATEPEDGNGERK